MKQLEEKTRKKEEIEENHRTMDLSSWLKRISGRRHIFMWDRVTGEKVFIGWNSMLLFKWHFW